MSAELYDTPCCRCRSLSLPLLYGQVWQVPFVPLCLPTCGVVSHTETRREAAAQMAYALRKAGV